MERREGARKRRPPNNHRDYAQTDSRTFGKGSQDTVATNKSPASKQSKQMKVGRQEKKKTRTGRMQQNSSNSIVSKSNAQLRCDGKILRRCGTMAMIGMILKFGFFNMNSFHAQEVRPLMQEKTEKNTI